MNVCSVWAGDWNGLAGADASSTPALALVRASDPSGNAPANTARMAGSASSNGVAAPLAGPLAGSALSPQTWSRAVQVLREKTVRR